MKRAAGAAKQGNFDTIKYAGQVNFEAELSSPTDSMKVTAARFNSMRYLFDAFKESLKSADACLKPILTQLCRLYGVFVVLENSGHFLLSGFYDASHIDRLQSIQTALLDQIRPQVIPLTDAFLLSDYVLNSPIGCADGDVYKRLIEKTLQSCPPHVQHPYFESVIKPVLGMHGQGSFDPIEI